jgi:hypothetical protein
VVLAGSCGGGGGAAVDAVAVDAGPVTFPYDVTISNGQVDVFTKGADRPFCTCQTDDLPGPGSCALWSGINCTSPDGDNARCISCITAVSVTSGGTTVNVQNVNLEPGHITVDLSSLPAGVELSLAITGCGHGTVQVPLGSGVGPTPTITSLDHEATVDNIAWTTDVDSPTALVSETYTVSEALCHVDQAQTYAFPLHQNQRPVDGVWVQAFGASTTVDTELGSATLWRGQSANMAFPSD